MAHSQQYVSQALKMYTSIQPAIPVCDLNVIDVQFREIPNTPEAVIRDEVKRLVARAREVNRHLF